MIALIILLATLVGIIWYFSNRRLSYFKDRNIPYLKSVPFVGAISDVLIGRKGIYDCMEDIYKKPQFENDKFFGIFMFHKPSLIIKDPEMIKQILVKDFNSFMNHHSGTDTHDTLGNDMMFMAKDSLWRNVRKNLTPFFSSGKIKKMFPVLDNVSDNLINHLGEQLSGGTSVELDVKGNFCLFTTDVIASCAYGIDANSFKNPNSEFVWFGRQIFGVNFHRGLEMTATFLLPEITKFFNFQFFTAQGTKFFLPTMKHVIEERERTKAYRNDLIDALIEIKNSPSKDPNEQPLSIETLIAQAAVFFGAGYETSATTATFMLYEIAKHKDVQDRVRNEIQRVLKKSNGILSYDIVMYETPYLQQIMWETLRLFPIVPVIDRNCTNKNGYSLEPFSDFVVPYKMPIYVPIFGIQRDEKYFPEPLKFDPERFSAENIDNVPAYTHLPFGTGGRICVGDRFAQMQVKTGVLKILRNYRVEMTDDTPREIKLAKNAFVIQSEVPIVLRFIKDQLEL